MKKYAKIRISIPEQLRRNAVALISLAVAISSLAYNSYRNEASEENRNIRFAAFNVVKELGEFQQLVLRNRYFEINEASDRVQGYGQAAMIRDLMMVMPAPAPESGSALYTIWDENADRLFDPDPGRRQEAEEVISRQIEEVRSTVLRVLKSLE